MKDWLMSFSCLMRMTECVHGMETWNVDNELLMRNAYIYFLFFYAENNDRVKSEK
jgi:hypothetical protein